MYMRLNRFVLLAAVAGTLSLSLACGDADNDELGTADGAGADRERHDGALRPGDANRTGDAVRPGDPGRVGDPVDGRPAGAVVGDGAHNDGVHDGAMVTPGAEGHEADNTANNRGAADGAKTPFDQSNAQPDLKVTADIRKAILAMDGMSTNADNVKIITSADGVAVRGVVESQSEIDAITKLVGEHAGSRKIDIQLSADPD